MLDAEAAAGLARDGIHAQAVRELDALVLIDSELSRRVQRDLADGVPTQYRPNLPATLACLYEDGIDHDAWTALQARVAAEPPTVNQQRRAEVPAEATRQLAIQPASSAPMGRKPLVVAVLTLLALAGAAAWWVMRPEPVPDCASQEVRSTLNGMVRSAQIGLLMDAVQAARPPSERPALTLRAVRDLHEVGWRADRRERGCLAELQDGSLLAVTVGRLDGDEGMTVRGQPTELVQARFGRVDAQGQPQFGGEPVGQPAMLEALRNAEALMRAEVLRDSQLLQQERRRQERLQRQSRLDPVNPDQMRPVADVEPTGPCTAPGDGTAAACPVLVSYNDELRAAFGNPGPHPMQATLTFVRSETGWRMGDDFAERWAEAVALSRMGGLRAAPAAPAAAPAGHR